MLTSVRPAPSRGSAVVTPLVCASCQWGVTALMMASYWNNKETVTVLLEAGADAGSRALVRVVSALHSESCCAAVHLLMFSPVCCHGDGDRRRRRRCARRTVIGKERTLQTSLSMRQRAGTSSGRKDEVSAASSCHRSVLGVWYSAGGSRVHVRTADIM